MFGACSSVQNFDIVANTIKTVAKVGCEIPSRFVLRQLDDVPIVAPGKSGWCEDFLAAYKHLCGQINLELAEDCPEFKKSFGPTRKGKILGIWFNSETLCWKLPEEKRISSLLALTEVSKQANPSLLQLQSLMGRLNVVSVMCPFMNTFKFNLKAVLSSLLKGYTTTLTAKALDDIRIWTNRLSHPSQWNPICPEKSEPPLTCYSFSSDATGFADNSIWTGQIGCGVLGLDEENQTILGYQTWWPEDFIKNKTDNKGSRFGNKTTTLEMVAIMLPFLLIPEKLMNKHIRIYTDNMACVYGIKDGYVKNDEYASIFIRAVYLISAYLGSVLHTYHVSRRSTWEARTADNFTRASTTSFLEKQILKRYEHLNLPEVLTNWLINPQDDWTLAVTLLQHVMNKTNPN
jgi:hypothetical protein